MPMRSATMDDLDALTDLFRAGELAELGRADSDTETIRRLLAGLGTDLAARSTVCTRDGRLAGFAALYPAPHLRELRAYLTVSPIDPGPVADVLIRKVHRWAGTAAVTVFQFPSALAAPVLFRHGWRVVRRYRRLTADLPLPTSTASDLPAGAVITVAADDADQRRAHAVLEAAVADHWGHRRRDFAEFRTDQAARDGHDPNLWWLAEVDGTPAATLIARASAGQAWISWFGTDLCFRGRGLGTALLATAFAALHARGCTTVAVDVDGGNASGALDVYARAGLRVLGEADQWRSPGSY